MGSPTAGWSAEGTRASPGDVRTGLWQRQRVERRDGQTSAEERKSTGSGDRSDGVRQRVARKRRIPGF